MTTIHKEKRIAVASIHKLPSDIKKNIMTEFVEQSTITFLLRSIALMIKQRAIENKKKYRFLFLRFNLDLTIQREEVSILINIMNGPTISYSNIWFRNHHYTPERLFSILNYMVDFYGPAHFIDSDSFKRFVQYNREYILQLQNNIWDQKAVLRKSLKDDIIIKTIELYMK